MADESEKPACKYGTSCYQRNEAHHDRFSHPPRDDHSNGTSKKHLSDDSGSSEKGAKRLRASPNARDHRSKSPVPSSSMNESSDDDEQREKTKHQKEIITKDMEFIRDEFSKESPFSQQKENKRWLESPAEFIRQKFLVQMPQDFYQFWEFCKCEAKENQRPENLFEKFGLELVGPFDVLAGKFDEAKLFETPQFLRHWRYYYDPPEFQVSAYIHSLPTRCRTFIRLF